MANGYNKIFTLTDIFNNEKLKGKIPLVNYKETEKGNRTNMKTLNRLVYESAKTSAKPYYKPLIATKNGNDITIGGKLNGDYNKAFMSVYKGLVAQTQMFRLTVNNGDMIRSALKEAQKVKKILGKEPKLWLRVGSMQEIELMNKRQINQLIDDVMRNIFYNTEYSETQNKYGVKNIPVNRSTNYDRRKNNWLSKVGEV